MNGNDLTQIAERAGQRYQLLLEAFRGAFLNIANSTRTPGAERTRNTLRRQVYDLARVFMTSEQGEMEDALLGQAYQGQYEIERQILQSPATTLSETAVTHGALILEALERELLLQIERDVSLMIGALRGMALAGALGSSPGGSGKRGRGAATQSRADALKTLDFEFLDRAGKRWPSARHVRIVWRQAMVIAWNEAALITGGAVGLAELEVTHSHGAYAHAGTLVAIGPDARPEAITWPAARLAGIFHPQANAWLQPVSQS